MTQVMTATEITEVLRLHRLYQNGEATGQHANLEGANLEGANLRRANLEGANLEGANLEGANLWGANLEGANLEGAYLRGAYLWGANLRGANLWGANLRGANLEGANLRGANLWGANLRGAYLEGANLRGAYLEGANLEGANLWGAYLEGANLWGAYLEGANLRGAYLEGAKNVPSVAILRSQIVPQEGSFRAFKRVRGGLVAVLEIPETAERVGGTTGRKCRASEALVLGFLKSKTEPATDITESQSTYDWSFIYRVGEVVRPTNGYCADPLVECTAGIHFFMSYEEAAEYF